VSEFAEHVVATPVRPDRDDPTLYLGDLGPEVYEVRCVECDALIAALDAGPVVPLRDALEERLRAQHECADSVR
jgi:hypothetical protein